MAADAMVEEVNYTMVTDLQISMCSKAKVTTDKVAAFNLLGLPGAAMPYRPTNLPTRYQGATGCQFYPDRMWLTLVLSAVIQHRIGTVDFVFTVNHKTHHAGVIVANGRATMAKPLVLSGRIRKR